MPAWQPIVIPGVSTASRRMTHMQRIRGMVMAGIRAGHSKDSIMHDLRDSHINTTEPHVLAYIDGVFDAIEALGVEC